MANFYAVNNGKGEGYQNFLFSLWTNFDLSLRQFHDILAAGLLYNINLSFSSDEISMDDLPDAAFIWEMFLFFWGGGGVFYFSFIIWLFARTCYKDKKKHQKNPRKQ